MPEPINLSGMSGEVRHELLKIAIQHENEKRPERLPIQLIDESDFIKHITNEGIDERFRSSRYQLLINSDGHYTCIDIDKRDGRKSLIILDATNDPRCDNLLMDAEVLKNGYKTIRALGLSWDEKKDLQKDHHSCSLFAFDHCVQLSCTTPNFHDELGSKRESKPSRFNINRRYIFWDDLPPNFICNAQSIKFLDAYEEKMRAAGTLDSLDEIMPNANGLSYREYIKSGIVTYTEGEEEFTHNESINLHILSKILNLSEAKELIKDQLAGITVEARADTDTTVEIPVLKAP